MAGEGSGNGDARHAQVSRDLRKAGFDETQAEALIAVVQEASTLDLSNLATKNDLAAVRSDLAVARSEMKNDLAALRSEMKNDNAATRSDLSRAIAEANSDTLKWWSA